MQTNWHSYGLEQAKGALPLAPLVIVVHMASVWVPYTSEAKEAIAPIPRSSRKFGSAFKHAAAGWLRTCTKRRAVREEFDKRTHLEKYLPHIGLALQQMLDLSDKDRDKIVTGLDNVLQEKRST